MVLLSTRRRVTQVADGVGVDHRRAAAGFSTVSLSEAPVRASSDTGVPSRRQDRVDRANLVARELGVVKGSRERCTGVVCVAPLVVMVSVRPLALLWSCSGSWWWQ